ncbi:hypothetical protein D1007_31043 [Hordeum vulgare]|nr:hypothetical protein D1007_31043 [Hordeum vulgare]
MGGQQVAVEAKATRASTLDEKEALAKRCGKEEDSLKAPQEWVEDIQQLQLWEEDVKACEDAHAKWVSEANATRVYEANAKLANREEEILAVVDAKVAADRVAISFVELTACLAPSSICRLEVKSPFVPQDSSYAKLSCELVKEIVGGAKKVDDILEEECCNLFSMATTHDFSHLLLRDPGFAFEEVMGPEPEESHGNLAAAMEGHVNTLLGKVF